MAKRKSMTPDQERVWRFCRAFHKRKGYPPRAAVIAEKFGISRVGAQQMLRRIVATGWMRRAPDAGAWIAVEVA